MDPALYNCSLILESGVYLIALFCHIDLGTKKQAAYKKEQVNTNNQRDKKIQ